MIKAVLFDLDDTLVDTTKLAELARKNAVENMVRHGLPVDFNTAYNELLELINEYGSNFGRHFDYLLRRLDLPQNPKWVAAGVIAYHNTKFAYLRSVKNSRRVLLELKREGYKVAVVTDGDPIKQWEKILRLELDEYFDEVFISDYLGVKKPHPKIFLKALKKLDVKPEEAVMVGDRLYSDIYGAKNVGMVTVWFRYGKYRDKEMEYVEYADFTIERLEDLLKIIRGLNNEEKVSSDTEVHAD
ncbi:TIGR02253 family HAD-type hydrolase [Thermococcus peptonophilus]|uniref:Glyceraldehyde 3-phosphate phosphatase n=1 Tax=Thermococcus peptonophilus TaxID=53952 RepID=A0A142CT41_9EURY|nr:TIGR02253 family HAD-type hydrolase [Thermococcus peptonophilus]AMQ17943.1 haloacid dehalogenase [Thermococcus peptonophilus]